MDSGTTTTSDEPQLEQEPTIGSLSPSRAGDFLSCPLLYRFRTIDRLPEPPSPEAVRGTVVHRVLELLFDLPASERTPARAQDLLEPAWHEIEEVDERAARLFPEHPPRELVEQQWLQSCRETLARWFTLEDPRRLEPQEREAYVEARLDNGLMLRGVVDRIDVAADGALRVVDYKTGRAPHPEVEARALFQLRFYALVLWRSRGVVPRVLQLVYLGDGQILRYEPDEHDLIATERKVLAVWEAVSAAREAREWLPQRGAMCTWCAHKALCPAYGGTPPPLPDPDVLAVEIADAATV